MAPAIVVERVDEEMAKLFALDSEKSQFEGFDLDEMPLNFLECVHSRENNERLSDNEDNLDVLLEEENGDNDVDNESTEGNDQE